MESADTIAAIATGVGGGIAILRLSGSDALAIGNRVWRGRSPLVAKSARQLRRGHVRDASGEVADDCLAVYMPGPNSYTGEDVVELQCHGGQLVARTILTALLRAGARHAEAGEFTKRAFLNGKIDLTQAEAVLDLIEAHSDMALHAANRQLEGQLRRRVDAVYAELREILAEVEVRMDFVDEDLDWQPSEQVRTTLQQAQVAMRELLAYRQDGEILRHGLRLVIAGAPNAGKSSLLNLLLGRDRAIVTNIPGTTRDVLEELAQIRGIPLRLVDTAGIRDAADIVERAGIERGEAAIRMAQLLIWVIDTTRPLDEQRLAPDLLHGRPVIIAANKTDLSGVRKLETGLDAPQVAISANTGAGLPKLLDAIEAAVWGQAHDSEPEFAINARHCALLEASREQVDAALAVLDEDASELVAVSLRAALDALGRVTGRTLQPDILENIFSKFCIGK
jgi:tRNA modification GTPase